MTNLWTSLLLGQKLIEVGKIGLLLGLLLQASKVLRQILRQRHGAWQLD